MTNDQWVHLESLVRNDWKLDDSARGQLLAELERLQNPWYDVDERLPERSKAHDWHSVDTLTYNTDDQCYYCAIYYFRIPEWRDLDGNAIEVTHWLPLPLPPKGD